MKNQKGITLIALVITIIVLLILAGVAIAMLSGENGILNQAENAKKETVAAEAAERINLALNAVKAESYAQLAKNSSWVAATPTVAADPDADPVVEAAEAAIDPDVVASLTADGFETTGDYTYAIDETDGLKIKLNYHDDEFDFDVTGYYVVEGNGMEKAEIPSDL